MELYIKLKNPQFCDDCPCLQYLNVDGILKLRCVYFEKDMEVEHLKVTNRLQVIRPKQCEDDLGV